MLQVRISQIDSDGDETKDIVYHVEADKNVDAIVSAVSKAIAAFIEDGLLVGDTKLLALHVDLDNPDIYLK